MVTNCMKKFKGFTIIELMIVVAIIGIIAAIGFPSYTTNLHKAGRAEGSALLLDVMEKQEQYYRRNRTYTVELTDLGLTGVVETERYKIVSPMEACANTTIRRCVLICLLYTSPSPRDS